MPQIQPAFESNLVDYFRRQLHEVSEQLVPTPHEDTLWYMSHMLARFGESDQLFSYDQGNLGIRPLALLYKDALESQDHRERCLILRQLGDLALFMGALFPDNYARRGIEKDYFVGMGGGAYNYLSENAHHNRHIFSELASTFTRMLELVARVCSRQIQFNASDILQLYQRWRKLRDPKLASQLQALGINVTGSTAMH